MAVYLGMREPDESTTRQRGAAAIRRRPDNGASVCVAPQQILDEIGASHRRKSARAVPLADQEQDALLIEETAIDLGDRKLWIPGVDRPPPMPLISTIEKFSPCTSSSAEAKRRSKRP